MRLALPFILLLLLIPLVASGALARECRVNTHRVGNILVVQAEKNMLGYCVDGKCVQLGVLSREIHIPMNPGMHEITVMCVGGEWTSNVYMGACRIERKVWWDKGLRVNIRADAPITRYCVEGRCVVLQPTTELNLFLGKKNAYDVTFICGGREYNAHITYFPVEWEQREQYILS